MLMFLLKALSIVIAGLLSLLALKHMIREMEAVKVRTHSRQTRAPQTRVRLRQDPRTGIYYPEG